MINSMPATLRRGLIGAWEPNASVDGTKLLDVSPIRNHCTLSANLHTPGPFGRSLGFNSAASRRGEIPDHAVYAVGSEMTALIWVRAAQFAANAAAFSQYDTTLNQRAWNITSLTPWDAFTVLLSSAGTAATKNYTASKRVTDGFWHLIGFTFKNGVLTLYQDGMPDTNPTKTADGAMTAIHNGTGSVWIGAQGDNGVAIGFWNGGLDRPMLWNRALSDQEILTYYRQNYLQYRLRKVQTLSTGTGSEQHAAARLTHQRSNFYANGRYWQFWADYSDGTPPYDVKFRSSTDGETWNADTTLRTTPIADAGWNVLYDPATNKVHFTNNLLHSANPLFWNGIEYRKGTPNAGGTITWDAGFQTAIATGTNVGDHSVALSTSNKIWIGYGDGDSGLSNTGNAMAIKNDNTDGTWATAAGFPVTIKAGVNDAAFAILSPIATGAMQATVYEWETDDEAQSYTVDAAGVVTSEGDVTTVAIEGNGGSNAKVGRIESVSRAGKVHLAYLRAGASDLRYRQRSTGGVWGTEIILATHGVDSTLDDVVTSPRISFDGDTKIIILWSNASSELWFVLSTDDGAAFSKPRKFSEGESLETSYEHCMPSLQTDGFGNLQLQYLNSSFQQKSGLLGV